MADRIPSPPRPRWWLWSGAGVLAIAAVLAGCWAVGLLDATPDAPVDPFPLPGRSPSPFRNTAVDVAYVGSAACVTCHQGRTATFRATGMGCSMAVVDAGAEPPDAQFDHPASQTRFQILRKAGQLWHREARLTAAGDEIELNLLPLKYVVGSGHFARTYLAEVDGFLVQSPVTWYASTQAWSMSPGYDRPDHAGFERPIGEGCLICHAGRASVVGLSQHRITIHEPALSCERCHGPGALHLARHGQGQKHARAANGVDDTIVNPAHLPRDRAEAVCQQCHLHSAAAVLARGKALGDFRPGLPLSDFRHDFRLEVGAKAVTVVGHVEQLHLSRCYQQSQTLTCTTCHNPHAKPAPEKRLAHHQAICLSCHDQGRCKVAPATLAAKSPDNNCVQCHMPATPTEVPHVAATHHRIAVHGTPPLATPGPPDLAAATLMPLTPQTHHGTIDQQRALGLAYLELARGAATPAQAATYRTRAQHILSQVRAAGLRDHLMEALLARALFDLKQGDPLALAEAALANSSLAGVERCAALYVVAAERATRKQYSEAIGALRELVQLRRHPHDWLLLAQCEDALGNRGSATQALQTAVAINPRLAQVHQLLARHFRQNGDALKAEFHERRAIP